MAPMISRSFYKANNPTHMVESSILRGKNDNDLGSHIEQLPQPYLLGKEEAENILAQAY